MLFNSRKSSVNAIYKNKTSEHKTQKQEKQTYVNKAANKGNLSDLLWLYQNFIKTNNFC